MKSLQNFLVESLVTPITKEQNEEILSYLRNNIKYPYVNISNGALGGYDSIYIKLSLDPKEEWDHGYIQNSRMLLFSVIDNKIENITAPREFKTFRATKLKNGYKDIAGVLKKYIDENSSNVNELDNLDNVKKHITDNIEGASIDKRQIVDFMLNFLVLKNDKLYSFTYTLNKKLLCNTAGLPFVTKKAKNVKEVVDIINNTFDNM